MTMGDLLDNPNQQVVRPDGSGPGEEGEGGSVREDKPAKKKAKAKAKDEGEEGGE